MRLAFLLVVSALLIASCEDRSQLKSKAQPPKSTPAPMLPLKYCGGDVKAGSIEAFYQRLADHLAASKAAVPMDFYDEMFSVISDDRRLLFRREEMGAGAKALPSLDDWREISRQGPQAIHDAGWRGCYIAHGKVWFEADGETFSLKGFNKDMTWNPPSS
jgi:hypothetical protein